jgi:hypothetical protein
VAHRRRAQHTTAPASQTIRPRNATMTRHRPASAA